MKPGWCDEKTWATADHLFRCSSADVIALALRKAHQRGRREGMEEAAEVAREMLVYADTTSEADVAIPAAIRAKANEVSS